MNDKYSRKELPRVWKSLTTGSEHAYATHAPIEKPRPGFTPLPLNEYPYTIVYEKTCPKWQQAPAT